MVAYGCARCGMKCCPLTAGFAVCWCGGNWPTLDEDLSLAGILEGRYGQRRHCHWVDRDSPDLLMSL